MDWKIFEGECFDITLILVNSLACENKDYVINERIRNVDFLNGKQGVLDELGKIKDILSSANRNASWYNIYEKIFFLHSDVTTCCSFMQDCSNTEDSIMEVVVRNLWRPFNSYSAIKLELCRNDYGKNYQFDFSGSFRPFFIVSEQALDRVGDILLPRGQVLPVITKSKKKKFFGYYPTNPLKGCFDKEKSIYREYPIGLMIDKPVLIEKISLTSICSLSKKILVACL